MRRSYSLTVDRLEDRCVPAVDLLVQTVANDPFVATESTTVVVQTPAPDQTLEAPKIVIATETFVIDGYLIDPNAIAPPPKPMVVDQLAPIPDAYWQTSPSVESLVPPVNDPFWY